MSSFLTFDRYQLEKARLDAYEREIPRLLNRVKTLEATLLEIRQELNVALIEMMINPTPSFTRVMNAAEKLYYLEPESKIQE